MVAGCKADEGPIPRRNRQDQKSLQLTSYSQENCHLPWIMDECETLVTAHTHRKRRNTAHLRYTPDQLHDGHRIVGFAIYLERPSNRAQNTALCSS
jgi:hypothetical protein